MADEISPVLTLIFQRTLDLGELPEDWKSANVSPIFKKGNRFKASNYRPVLTSLCCKRQKHIITSNVMSHLDHHKILTDCQHGFRARQSCENHLLMMVHELAETVDKGWQMGIVILDFPKAFDHVPHRRLLGKLHHYGIRGQTHGWIKSFLAGRTQQIIVDRATSEKAPVESDVPQGTVLGLLLFLLFTNDLPDWVTSRARLFADDCIIYRKIQTQDDCKQLQRDLYSLAQWESTWSMSFHADKCNVLRVIKKRAPINSIYKLKGQELEELSTSKYLGVDLSSNLEWKEHIDRTVKKANSELGFLGRNLRINNVDTKSSAYITLVRPHLEYFASIWSPHTDKSNHKLEMIQRRASRYCTN